MDFVELDLRSSLVDGTVSRPSQENCVGFRRKINTTLQINYYEIKLDASKAILSEKNSSSAKELHLSRVLRDDYFVVEIITRIIAPQRRLMQMFLSSHITNHSNLPITSAAAGDAETV